MATCVSYVDLTQKDYKLFGYKNQILNNIPGFQQNNPQMGDKASLILVSKNHIFEIMNTLFW